MVIGRLKTRNWQYIQRIKFYDIKKEKEHFQNAAKKGKTCHCNLFSEIQEVENHPIYIGTY